MRLRTPALIALASVAGISLIAVQQSMSRSRDVARLYAKTCTNCHGPKLTGAQGPSLVDDEWRHGGDDASIAKSIHDGQPAAGMPPFGVTLSAPEIRALVIYIREEAPNSSAGRRGLPSRQATCQ